MQNRSVEEMPEIHETPAREIRKIITVSKSGQYPSHKTPANKRKLLGKYSIIESSGDTYLATATPPPYQKHFSITRKAKSNDEFLDTTFSYKAQNLSTIHHENISNVKVEEDEEYFYFIQEKFGGDCKPINITIFDKYDQNLRYKKILDCYLQIHSALSFIDKNGFYHGNINPKNILVDGENKVYLLDFGKSYFYGLNKKDSVFLSPEAILGKSVDIRSDIFSFGLCMLKILLDGFEDFDFEKMYKSPSDINDLLWLLLDEYELEGVEEEIFSLISEMLELEPENRISLMDLGIKLNDLLKQYKTTFTFEINLSPRVIEKHSVINNIPIDEVLDDLREKIEGANPYWLMEKYEVVEDIEYETIGNIKILCNEVIFCCSAGYGGYFSGYEKYFFCFAILDNAKIKQEIQEKGIYYDNYINFILSTGDKRNNRYLRYDEESCDDATRIKRLLEKEYSKNQIARNFIDEVSIQNEEKLLEAKKESIKQKKIKKYAYLLDVKAGGDTLHFKIIDADDKEFKIKYKLIIKEFIQTKHLEQDILENYPMSYIIAKYFEPSEREINGEVKDYNSSDKELVVKLKNYKTLNIEKGTFRLYEISTDVDVEEIILKKQENALEALKRKNVVIQNFLEKINEPRELSENELVEIDDFFNKDLDEDQKDVVRKALSLDEGCELLLIQGPPGTGKTTTIVEIIKQFQKRNKHYKILVSSQSNQAVDNVLERIGENEDKILRIGSDKTKMSEKARDFIPEKVLDKLIKENLKRIETNKIKDENQNIESRLQNLRDEFEKVMQCLIDNNDDKDLIELFIKNIRLFDVEFKLQNLQDEFKKALQHLTSKSDDENLTNLFLKNIRLIFGTLIGISSWKDFRGIYFDVAIIDEAGRATLSELLVPCIKAKRIILLGDHKQLAPVIDDDTFYNLSSEATEDIGVSFFERFFNKLESNKDESPHLKNFYHTLKYNYRSHENICNLYSKAFYDGALQTSESIRHKREHKIDVFTSNVVWLDTSKKRDRGDRQQGTGKDNPCNADVIAITLKTLKMKNKIAKENIENIGVITPYIAQKELLQTRLKDIKKEYKNYLDISIDIGTVDSFQGSDRDLIIYDCVRSSKNQGRIDFIADEKRLNVSLSRAKKLLLIVGDMEFLQHSSTKDNPFKEIIQCIKDTNQIISLKD